MQYVEEVVMERSGAFERYVYRHFKPVAACVFAMVVLAILFLD
jgi:hypothetical protein